MLDEYSAATITVYGNEAAFTGPTAMTPYVETMALVASVVISGVTYYVCSFNIGEEESLLNTPDFYSPDDPRRSGRKGVVDPNTGLYPYIYSTCRAFIDVADCEPNASLHVRVICEYSVRYDSTSPVSAITGAGYSLNTSYPGTQYKKIVGDITHLVTQDTAISTLWHIASAYDKYAIGAANIMSAFPATIAVEPAWNPFSMKTILALT